MFKALVFLEPVRRLKMQVTLVHGSELRETLVTSGNNSPLSAKTATVLTQCTAGVGLEFACATARPPVSRVTRRH